MAIETVNDYIQKSQATGLEYCFESKIPITSGGATIYSIVEKPSEEDKEIHVRPLNGRDLKKDLSVTLHIPIWQHREDKVSSIPRENFN